MRKSGKVISSGEKSGEGIGNNLLKESKTPSLPSVTSKEVGKDLKIEPLSPGLSKDMANPLKDLQVDKKIDVEKNKPSENNTDKLLGEKDRGSSWKRRSEKIS
ncbi:hypothetical protein GOM44_04580 [Wolbachia endosymbiont of Atemnus politus]|uniref:hypothetical protein n=1 Tax=Wolbachia endosymbiont of Atemnus politus TaxID=2682840 RepID=UPI0015722186|nr:hypothetical protein [Wolbachia endosymbiont of Atemnus politus]NSX83594.1 hypothetical protein [Wolbachia endosymbiont of Atemnus politus]